MMGAHGGTPGTRLRAKLELAQPVLTATAERLWASPFVRELYPAYLCTMHAIVRSAVPLMRAALEQLAARRDGTEVAAILGDYLERHMREESGHDQWLLEDLEATSTDPQRAWETIPSPRVATLVGAQYYWLYHHHPVALLGHIAAIESYPPPPGFAERLRGLTGYPPTAFRAIARHEVLDVHHRRELHALLDRIPLERSHEQLVGLSALHTLHAGVEVFEELYERFASAS